MDNILAIQDELQFEGVKLATNIVLAVKNGRVSDSINKVTTKEIRKAGYTISFEEAVVLFLLFHHGGLTQREIAETLDKDSPSITRLIDQLEAGEYLIRQNSKEDRRAKKIYLTDRGKHITPKITDICIDTFKKAFSNITHNEIEAMQSVLRRLMDNLRTIDRL